MQVVQTDVALVDAGQGQDLVQILHGLRRLHQKDRPGPAAHIREEFLHLGGGLEVGEHQSVGTGIDDGVDLLPGPVVNGVHPDQKLGMLHRRPDGPDIRQGVVRLDRIHTPLAQLLADGFQIHEDPVHTGLVGQGCDPGVIGDVHEFDHSCLTCRAESARCSHCPRYAGP